MVKGLRRTRPPLIMLHVRDAIGATITLKLKVHVQSTSTEVQCFRQRTPHGFLWLRPGSGLADGWRCPVEA